MVNMNIDSIVDYLSDDESDSEMPVGCVRIHFLFYLFNQIFWDIEFGCIKSST